MGMSMGFAGTTPTTATTTSGSAGVGVNIDFSSLLGMPISGADPSSSSSSSTANTMQMPTSDAAMFGQEFSGLNSLMAMDQDPPNSSNFNNAFGMGMSVGDMESMTMPMQQGFGNDGNGGVSVSVGVGAGAGGRKDVEVHPSLMNYLGFGGQNPMGEATPTSVPPQVSPQQQQQQQDFTGVNLPFGSGFSGMQTQTQTQTPMAGGMSHEQLFSAFLQFMQTQQGQQGQSQQGQQWTAQTSNPNSGGDVDMLTSFSQGWGQPTSQQQGSSTSSSSSAFGGPSSSSPTSAPSPFSGATSSSSLSQQPILDPSPFVTHPLNLNPQLNVSANNSGATSPSTSIAALIATSPAAAAASKPPSGARGAPNYDSQSGDMMELGLMSESGTDLGWSSFMTELGILERERQGGRHRHVPGQGEYQGGAMEGLDFSMMGMMGMGMGMGTGAQPGFGQ
jgi:hypothetical protein